jgi:5-methylcytosine-specific restriction endonuclease McrA
MIYYRCPHCGKRVPRGSKCGCGFKREYARPEGTRAWYHTQRWTDLRAAVMSRYGGIDQYALHKYGRILAADTVHHIVPAEEEPGLFWSPDNLIPVSRLSHDEIHTTYRAAPASKSSLQDVLKSLVHEFSDF